MPRSHLISIFQYRVSQISYMRRSSSSVKGSFCSPLPSADALPLGFFTCLDGLRSSHSLDRQKSKKARTTDMSRLAVGTLTFHGNADLSGHGETRIVHPVELVVSQEIVHKHRLTVRCHLISHARYCPRVRAWAVTAAKLASRQEHRSEEHTSELQSRQDLVCRLLLEK